MKIAIIVRYLTISGGVEREVMMVAKEYIKMGHEVKIYTYRYDKDLCFPGLMKDLDITALDKTNSNFASRFAKIRRVGGFFRELEENQRAKNLASVISPCDVLNPFDQIPMRVSYYYKKLYPRVPSVLMLSDLHIASWSLFTDPLFERAKPSIFQRFTNYFRDLWERHLFFGAQDKITVLNYRTQDFVNKYVKRDSSVIRSAVDSSLFVYKARTAINDKKIKILANGIFYIHRRFEDIIEAVSLLRKKGFDASLRIIGNYSHKDTARAYHEKLLSLARTLGVIEKVEFAGQIKESSNLVKEYQNADVFVFASHMQTWGIAVFEAMASGTPVVLCRTPGASEVLADGENVLLSNPAEPETIASAVELLATDEKKYLRMSEVGSRFVREEITWNKYAAGLAALFEEVSDRRK